MWEHGHHCCLLLTCSHRSLIGSQQIGAGANIKKNIKREKSLLLPATMTHPKKEDFSHKFLQKPSCQKQHETVPSAAHKTHTLETWEPNVRMKGCPSFPLCPEWPHRGRRSRYRRAAHRRVTVPVDHRSTWTMRKLKYWPIVRPSRHNIFNVSLEGTISKFNTGYSNCSHQDRVIFSFNMIFLCASGIASRYFEDERNGSGSILLTLCDRIWDRMLRNQGVQESHSNNSSTFFLRKRNYILYIWLLSLLLFYLCTVI